MEIKRDWYLNRLISCMWDRRVKVITGVRGCGKTYLLQVLFQNYLLENQTDRGHILSFELGEEKDIKYRDPMELVKAVREKVEGRKERFYLFVDEIHLSGKDQNPCGEEKDMITFYDALRDLLLLENLDIYVTGSSLKMLSVDMLTELQGRSDEIRLYPFSFAEYYEAVGGDPYDAYESYAVFGGMPRVLSLPTEEAKTRYLQSLISEACQKDIMQRRKVLREDVLSVVFDLICSLVGSPIGFTDVVKMMNARENYAGKNKVTITVVRDYMHLLAGICLIGICRRVDKKSRSGPDRPGKFYCVDPGLRNACAGFRRQEMPGIMESIIYNELRRRDYAVQIGIVCSAGAGQDRPGSPVKKPEETYFIAEKDGKKVYIQSVYAIPGPQKEEAESGPFVLTADSFPKAIIRHDIRGRQYDKNGILNIGITDFLLDGSVF